VRNAYLKEMGIDVWVLRRRSESVQRESVLIEARVPEFHLCFLNYRSFGVCLSLGYDQEVISPMAKRFIGDIALSINGSAGQPVLNNLKWPISRRESGKRPHRSLEDVVLQRLTSLPSLVLVFGDEAAAIIPGLQYDESDTCLLAGQQILILGSIGEICQGAAGKRDLWRKLNPLRSAS